MTLTEPSINSGLETPVQIENIYAELVKFTRDFDELINPDGVYCRRVAMNLVERLKYKFPGTHPALAKVKRRNEHNLRHKGGGNYNFHYLVVLRLNDQDYALDAFLPEASLHTPVLKQEYLAKAYTNPGDVRWDEKIEIKD